MTTTTDTTERDVLQARLREAQQHVKQLYAAKQDIERRIRREQFKGNADPDYEGFNALVVEANEAQRAYDAAWAAEDRLQVEWRSFNEAHPEPREFHRFNPPVQ